MLTFQRERYLDIAHEFPPLYALHFMEVALDKERIPLAPDWAEYARLDRAGRLFVLTARAGNRLVGYFFTDVGKGLHNCTSVIARTDMFYLLPEFRTGWNGYRLIKKAVGMLKFDKMAIQTKHEPDCSVIFRRLGFTAVETVYTKVS